MVKVKKGNRILKIEDTEKARYLSDGYDVVEFDEKSKTYQITEEATGGKTYTPAEYNTLKKSLIKAQEEIKGLKKRISSETAAKK